MARVETIGETDFIVVSEKDGDISLDQELKISGKNRMHKTSGSKTVSLKKAISSLIKGFSDDISKIDLELKPKTIELELSISFLEEANMWILAGKSEQKISIKLSW